MAIHISTLPDNKLICSEKIQLSSDCCITNKPFTSNYIYHQHHVMKITIIRLGGYVMKPVAAGTHLPTPWVLEPAKHMPIHDYCLGCSFVPYSANTRYFFTVE